LQTSEVLTFHAGGKRFSATLPIIPPRIVGILQPMPDAPILKALHSSSQNPPC